MSAMRSAGGVEDFRTVKKTWLLEHRASVREQVVGAIESLQDRCSFKLCAARAVWLTTITCSMYPSFSQYTGRYP